MKTSSLALPALVALLLFTLGLSGQAQNMTLRTGDMFTMRLMGAPTEYTTEFTGEYTVAEDGTVGIPEIGAVKAAGLTPTQLARSIQAQLVQMKIFTKPVAEISVPQQSRLITIGGGVRAPGAQQWGPDMTLTSAVSRAGGASDFGDISKIKIRRDGKVTMFNLKKVDKDATQNPKLMPGDEVEVGGGN